MSGPGPTTSYGGSAMLFGVLSAVINLPIVVGQPVARGRLERHGNVDAWDPPSPTPCPSERAANWRTPAVIIVCGCLIAMIGFGPRSALGFFLNPMSQAHGWGREVFALSVAMQTLLYGRRSAVFRARLPTASAPSG